MRKTDAWIPRVALLWAGVLLGCSFIATTAKFQAPSLTLPTALEVGRVTFRALGLAEMAFVIAAVLLLRWRRSPIWVAVAALAVQWLAVMPFLNARTDAVVRGLEPHGPPWHVVYVALELVKVGALLVAAIRWNGETPSDP